MNRVEFHLRVEREQFRVAEDGTRSLWLDLVAVSRLTGRIMRVNCARDTLFHDLYEALSPRLIELLTVAELPLILLGPDSALLYTANELNHLGMV
jgi:hypothetical protein